MRYKTDLEELESNLDSPVFERLFTRLIDGFFIGLGVLLAVVFVSSASKCSAAQIPQEAYKYQKILVLSAQAECGLSAPVALFAAQIHQESLWQPGVISSAGAQGLAQFMPATAKWLASIKPELTAADPYNAAWAIQAMCAYNNWHYNKIKNTASASDHWAFALSAYNGGLGWVQRDRALAASTGFDPARYWQHTEQVNAGRSKANFAENRAYPRRIFALQHIYTAAGWGQVVSSE